MTQATDETPAAAPSPSPPPASETSGSRTLDDLTGPIEAVLLCADRPVAVTKLAAAIGLSDDSPGTDQPLPPEAKADLAAAIDQLNADYETSGRSFRIETIAGGYRLMTLPRFARCIAAFQKQKVQNRLSKPAVETLAIVAYRQPVTRAEIESIRGVACGEVLKTLMDHRLVTIQGRAEELGRPILYGTTRQFLDTFGLASLKDLPPVETGARP
ncbi:Segregation and condensation protein B [hydrothermal vent metagenome]|uniref:Segregation and condensation protein B n=1 Tax=hydrothermal vent metagenome TaxID=652676 RepID=A0A3B1D502_9ZZZZ